MKWKSQWRQAENMLSNIEEFVLTSRTPSLHQGLIWEGHDLKTVGFTDSRQQKKRWKQQETADVGFVLRE